MAKHDLVELSKIEKENQLYSGLIKQIIKWSDNNLDNGFETFIDTDTEVYKLLQKKELL